MTAKRKPVHQPTLDGIPALPPERPPGRPRKEDAAEHAQAIRKAVLAGRPMGKAAGHKRAAKAVEHAERVDPGWTAEAYSRLMQYAREVGSGGFLVEEARVFAESKGVAAPREQRAWGGIAKSAAAAGRLEKCGYGLDSFGSPKTKWRLVTL